MARNTQIVLVVAFSLWLAACGSDSGQPVPGPSSALSAYFGEQPAPDKVDPELWRRLVSEFDRVLAAQGTARRVSAAPIGNGSDVADLWVSPDGGGGADMRWSYRNQGDLNLDGTVTITDLTPIGVHYLKSSTSSSWIEHQIADADSNGVVSITDLTPIGVNFGGKVAGYAIQSRVFGTDEWFPLGWVPLVASMPGSTHYPQYSLHLSSPLANLVYRVVPTSNDTEPYDFGPPSNEVLYGLGNVHMWSQQCGGTERSGQSILYGPDSQNLAWSLTLPGTSNLYYSPVADAYGTTYTTTSAPNPGMMTPGPGTLFAVDRHGILQWTYRSGHTLPMPPALSIDETILVQEDGGTVLAFTRDGKLKWVHELTAYPGSANWGMLITNDDIIVAADGAKTLYGIELNGAAIWSRLLPDFFNSFPTLLDNSAVLPLGDSGVGFYALGNGAAGTPLAVNSYLPAVLDNDGATVLFTSVADNAVAIYPLLSPIPTSYVPASGSVGYAPVVISPGSYAIARVQDAGAGQFQTIIAGFDDNGAEQWTQPLSAGVFGPMAVDPDGNIYFAGFSGDANAGVYCIDSTHSISWFYPTGGLTPGAPCPAYNNLLVFHVAADAHGEETLLTAIGVDTP